MTKSKQFIIYTLLACLCIITPETLLSQDAACPILRNEGSTTTHALRVFNSITQIEKLGKTEWQNTDAMQSLDGNAASVEVLPWNRSYELRFSNLDFNIPQGAIINGIQFQINGHAEGEGNAIDYSVRLLDASGNYKGMDRANAAIGNEWLETDNDSTMLWKYGYSQDLWETTWDPSEINSEGFGVAIQLTNMTSRDVTAFIDQAVMDITYLMPFQHCEDKCIPYFVKPVEGAIDYNWIYPPGFGDHPDIGGSKNIVNLYPITANFGTYELCVQTVFTTHISEPCCAKIEYSNCEPAAIGNRVWNDHNANGIQDNGEDGVADVGLTLYTDGRIWRDRTRTDASGNYSFTNLPKGSYFIAVDNIQGKGTSLDFATDEALNSDFANIYLPNSSNMINLDYGESNQNVDFGLFDFASFAGTAWIDDDGNGLREVDEVLLQTEVILLDEDLNQVNSMMTDSTGTYIFDELTPGTYAVAFEIPDSTFETTLLNEGNDTAIDSDISFDGNYYRSELYTLLSNEHIVNIDAGFVLKRGSITGIIWSDGDGNSLFENESGIEGIVIQLKDCDDDLISETTTDSEGKYEFNDLLSGKEYIISYATPDGLVYAPFVFDNLVMTDGRSECHLLGAEEELIINGGLIPYNQIGDQIWLDTNRDGIFDDNEQGLENINVQLYNDQGTLLFESLSDENGNYLFENLLPGLYLLMLDSIPNDLKITSAKSGQNESLDSDFVLTSNVLHSDTIRVENGQFNDMIDAGFIYKEAFVDGYIWNDRNGDGFLTSNETFMEDEKVYLFDCNGNQMFESKTDDEGYFYFDAVIPNQEYYLSFNELEGYQFSFDPGDTDVSNLNGTGTTDCFLVNPLDSITKRAAYAPLGSIGDFVWLDENRNGIQDPDESGMENVSVQLRDVFNSVVATAETDINGRYLFEDVYPATYNMLIPQIDEIYGLTDFKVIPGGTNISNFYDNNGEIRSSNFNLFGGIFKENLDAGLIYVTGTITGNVWSDGNGDANLDSNENGLESVIVELYNCDGTLVETTSTSAEGDFEFTEILSQNEYYVYFQLEDNFYYSIAPGDTDIDHQNGMGTTSCFEVQANQSVELLAGLAPASRVGDFVWLDENRNGTQDASEIGLAGITVNLLDVFGNIAETTTTDSEGMYNIDFIYPARYAVELLGFDDDLTITKNHVNPGDPLNSVFIENTTEIRTSFFNLYFGKEKLNIDGGFVYKMGGLDGSIWSDANGDGVRLTDDLGIENVAVNLFNCDGELIETVSTDQNGNYTFTEVIPLVEYYIEVEAEAGFVVTNQGSQNDLTDSNGPFTSDCFMVNASSTTTINAGLAPLSLVGDYIWFDENDNGLQDASESGLTDIEVILLDAQGGIVDQTATDESGFYTFENIYPGSYTVEIGEVSSNFKLAASGLESIFEFNNGVVTSPVLNLEAGIERLDVDAGFVRNNVALTGMVWSDGNGDAIQDIDDFGLSGVVVIMYACNGVALAEAVTDNAGRYAFDLVVTNLDYYLEFVAPDHYTYPRTQGDTDITNDNGEGTTSCFGIMVGNVSQYNGALVPLGSIGDFVWLDANKNSIQDASETGVSDIIMSISDANNNEVDQVITSSTGEYLFTDLYPDTYTIRMVTGLNDFGLVDYKVGSDDMVDSDFEFDSGSFISNPVSLSNGDEIRTVDLGLIPNFGSISGKVVEDLSANDQIDAGDPALEGITIHLLDANGDVLSTETSGSDGSYSFSDLTVGLYFVQFELPNDYYFSNPNVFADDIDFDVTEDLHSSATSEINITVDEVYTNVDAGMYQYSAIGDYIWNDADEDGVQGTTEMGLNDMEVFLYDETKTQVVTSAMTDANGNYLFDDLKPGNYFVNIIIEENQLVSPKAATNADQDSDFEMISEQVLFSDLIVLTSGMSNFDIDAGIYNEGIDSSGIDQATSISGIIWDDLNGDGLTTGENGISGIRVVLITENGILVDMTDTGMDPDEDNGFFIFEDLDPGNYYLEYQLPSGSIITDANIGTDPTINSAITESNGSFTSDVITLNDNEELIANAGFYYGASLGDFVWNDVNGNGIQDSGETGVNDILLRLFDDNNASIGIMTTINHPSTGEPGYYSFSDLKPGEYFISIGLQAGMFISNAMMGTNVSLDSDIDNSNGFNTTRTLTVLSNDEINDIDMGVQQDPSSVGSKFWADINGNGVQDDNEPGINDALVELYTETGFLVSTTMTHADPSEGDGYYIFENQQAGNYFVRFELPSGYLSTISDTGGNDSKDSDITNMIMDGATNIFNLDPGETNLEVDGGVYLPSQIGDYVFDDVNENGIQDPDEVGLGGVVVSLTKTDENFERMTVSDEDGFYTFEDLRAGPYYLKFELPDGKIFSPQSMTNLVSDSNVDQNGITETINLAYNEANLDVDAGLHDGEIVLGNRVWLDMNGNGLQDFNENGMEGVVINLLDENLDFVQSETTNFLGEYSFINPATGLYYLEFTAPTGYEFSPAKMGFDVYSDSDPDPNGLTDPLALTPGLFLMNIDAGLTPMIPVVNEDNSGLSFSGRNKEEYNFLNWADVNPSEGFVYEIWRSTNSKQFEKISESMVLQDERKYQLFDADLFEPGEYDYELLKKDHRGFIMDNSRVKVYVSEYVLKKTLVYPNPTINDFMIEVIDRDLITQDFEYQILDANGIIVRKDISNSEKEIDISGLAKGIYTVKVKLDNKTDYHKLLIN